MTLVHSNNKTYQSRLDSILSCDQQSKQIDKTPQKISFPLINTRLKKTLFTKYHSAFISQKYIYNDQTSPNKINLNRSIQKQNNKTLNVQMSQKQKQKISNDIQLNGKMWKIHQKHAKSIFISSSQIPYKNKINSYSKNLNIGKETYSTNDMNKIRFNSSLLTKHHKYQSNIYNPQNNNNLAQINKQKIAGSTSRISMPKSQRNKSINQEINQSSKMITIIKNKNNKSLFYNQNKQKLQFKKLQQKLGLFSYLKRDFVINGDELNQDKIKDYFKNNSLTTRNLQSKVNIESRIFLKERLKKDYRSYKDVQKLKKDISSKTIKQEMRQKKKYYHQQYIKKQSSAYISFLSLPKELKIKIIRNLTKTQEKQNIKK